MSDVSTLDAVLERTHTATANAAVVQPAEQAGLPEPDDDDDAQDVPEPSETGEKQFESLLRKAERAFVKGNRGMLLSRVECGKHCHECYALRVQQGHKNRGFTSQIIFNRLAVHADSKADCDASQLAQMFKAVEILCPEERWKAMAKLPIHPLTIGKLEDLSKLITRMEGTELYHCFDSARLDDAKALFQWACGDGINKPSRQDIAARVLELKDPEKFAAKQEEKRKAEEARKAAEAKGETVAEEDEADEPEPPKNLIATEPDKSRPAPNWKDVPDGMASLMNEGRKQEPGKVGEMRAHFVEKLAALTVKDAAEWMLGFFHEGCKRNPGKSHEIVREFAKLVHWTAPTIKGLVAGIGDAKDGGETQLQTLSDTIASEYSLYPSDEVEAAA
jgi:hypothetical protein